MSVLENVKLLDNLTIDNTAFQMGISVPVDWDEVVIMRRKASTMLSAKIAEFDSQGKLLKAADKNMLGRSIVSQVVHEHAEELALTGAALWSATTENNYVTAVYNSIFGYGRLQPLFEIENAENIEINGCDCVMIQESDGRRWEHPPVADSDAELVEAIRFLGESASPARPFDDAHPTMTLALGNRYRLHAVGFGLTHRPTITIRQHTMIDVTLPQLVQSGMLPEELAKFLHAAVMARKSIIVSGDQGAGKTTLLRALVDAIPLNERFGTLETDYELLTHLQSKRRNVVAFQARVGMGEQIAGRAAGEVTVADLFPEALRQNLARLIVGEVRGAEAGSLFEAAQVGPGLMATTHSYSAQATIDRLASRVAQGGVLSIPEAYYQIAQNLHLLVHVKIVDETWKGGIRHRFVSEVRQLTGAVENGRPITHLVYTSADGCAGYLDVDSQFDADLQPFYQAWDR